MALVHGICYQNCKTLFKKTLCSLCLIIIYHPEVVVRQKQPTCEFETCCNLVHVFKLLADYCVAVCTVPTVFKPVTQHLLPQNIVCFLMLRDTAGK